MSGPQHVDHEPEVSHAAPSPMPDASALPEFGPTEEIESKLTAQPVAAIEENGNVVSNQKPPSQTTPGATTPSSGMQYDDPLSLGTYKKPHVSQRQLKEEYPKANKRKLKKFYTRQNELIDTFLASGDEERLGALDMELNGPKIKFAIYASSGVNFCLFVIQMYAAISTGSLALFATAADAFVRKIRCRPAQ
jgi:hypothetical protein